MAGKQLGAAIIVFSAGPLRIVVRNGSSWHWRGSRTLSGAASAGLTDAQLSWVPYFLPVHELSHKKFERYALRLFNTRSNLCDALSWRTCLLKYYLEASYATVILLAALASRRVPYSISDIFPEQLRVAIPSCKNDSLINSRRASPPPPRIPTAHPHIRSLNSTIKHPPIP